MSEWWTYRPSDFLMFAPRTYWRMFELHNAQWWPLQPVLLLIAFGVVAWAARHGEPALRAGSAGLAAAWSFVGASFLLQRYAPINWAASAFAAGFALQAVVLAALAVHGGLRVARAAPRRAVGALLIGGALALHPLLVLAAGRPWTQAEAFGLAPDPTAIATLGWLLVADGASRTTRRMLGAARALPIAWCATSAATLWTMGSAQAWVPAFAAAATAFALAAGRAPTRRASPSL